VGHRADTGKRVRALIDADLLGNAREIQRRLESFYALEAGPDVADFVRVAAKGERETLLVRQNGDAVEVGLLLPARTSDASLDEGAQLIEGVSHFVYFAERARTELHVTELELELQAEVDKFVVLAFEGTVLVKSRAVDVRRALFDGAEHLHTDETERGHRYRLASRLAERVAARLVERPRGPDAQRFLRHFYRAGQTDKLRLAAAA
jgi:hypothetical protein